MENNKSNKIKISKLTVKAWPTRQNSNDNHFEKSIESIDSKNKQ